MSLAAGLITSRLSWAFLGKSRRHTVTLVHNTLSGAQTLFVDGAEFFSSGWKYKLTSTLHFVLDGSTVEIHVRTDDAGSLTYALSLDAREVPLASGGAYAAGAAPVSPSTPAQGSGGVGAAGAGAVAGAGSAVSTWIVALPRTGLHQVEFLHSELEVIVDGSRVEAAGDFVEQGSAYSFDVAGVAATITALPIAPSERRNHHGAVLRTSLVVEGVGAIDQSELLGLQ